MDIETESGTLRRIQHFKSPFDREQERRRGGCETWSVAFSPDNSYFAWSNGHHIVTLINWDNCDNRSPNGRKARTTRSDSRSLPMVINCGDTVWSLAFGVSEPDDNRNDDSRRRYYNFSPPSGASLVLAVGLNNGKIKIYTCSGKLITELLDHRDVVRDLKFSPNGSLTLLSASRDSTLKLWDLKDDGNMFKTLKHAKNEWIMCCAWSPDSKWAASGGSGKDVYVWQTKNWTLRRRLTAHLHTVSTCQFSPDGAVLATGSYDTAIILWDYVKGQIMTVLWHMYPPPRPIFASGANEHFVRHISFSPDGEHVASACDDGYVRVWNIFCSSMPEYASEIQEPSCSAYSNDGQYLAVGTRHGSAHLFAAPMSVQSLASICRSVIRRHAPIDAIDQLPVPDAVLSFLSYKDVHSSGHILSSYSYAKK